MDFCGGSIGGAYLIVATNSRALQRYAAVLDLFYSGKNVLFIYLFIYIYSISTFASATHNCDRRLDAVKQTQNEHRQNPADLDRNAPAAVKGRHQWDRTAAGHGIVLDICVGLGRDSWQSAQDDR